MTKIQSATVNSVEQNRPAKTLEMVSDTLAFGVVFAISLTIVQRGFGFIRGILFCRMMSEQELGQWSMVYSFLMLLAPLAVLGLPGCFGRFVEHYLQRGQLTTFVRRISVISCFLTFGLAFCMFLMPERFSSFIFRSSEFVGIINAMAFALIFVTANNFMSTLMESLRQVRRATLMRFITGVSFAVVGTGLIAGWHDGTIAATIGFGVACGLGLIPAITFLTKHRDALADSGESLTHATMWKRIAPFALWLWASNFVTNMFEVSDRYMLVHWSDVGVDEAHGFVGQYHSGRVLPLLLIGVGVVIDGVVLPYATALWEKRKQGEAQDLIKLAYKLMAFGFTLAASIILLLSPLVFEQIFEGRYDGGLSVLPITMLYCIWFSMINTFALYLLVVEKGKWIFAMIGGGLIVNLVLNVILIPSLGLWGAVIATTLSMFVTLVAIVIGNHWCGLKVEVGVIVAASIPLLVMLPVWAALLAILLLTIVMARSELLFNAQEKSLAQQWFESAVARFTSR